jgi:hypothetical protein
MFEKFGQKNEDGERGKNARANRFSCSVQLQFIFVKRRILYGEQCKKV